MENHAKIATQNGMKRIRDLCNEAIDHEMGWKSFIATLQYHIEVESSFVETASKTDKILLNKAP